MFSVVFYITFVLRRNSLQQVLPCTTKVDAARNILQARVPNNFQLKDVIPVARLLVFYLSKGTSVQNFKLN